MAAGEEGDEDFADDPLLTDDDLGQLALETAGQLGDALDRNRRRIRLTELQTAFGHGHELRPVSESTTRASAATPDRHVAPPAALRR